MTAAMEHADEPWVPANTWGSRLAQLRQFRGWNVKQAARACNLSDETWRQWEKNGRSPQKFEEVARQIAENTGVDLDWLLTGNARSRWLSPVPDVAGQMVLDLDACAPELQLVHT